MTELKTTRLFSAGAAKQAQRNIRLTVEGITVFRRFVVHSPHEIFYAPIRCLFTVLLPCARDAARSSKH